MSTTPTNPPAGRSTQAQVVAPAVTTAPTNRPVLAPANPPAGQSVQASVAAPAASTTPTPPIAEPPPPPPSRPPRPVDPLALTFRRPCPAHGRTMLRRAVGPQCPTATGRPARGAFGAWRTGCSATAVPLPSPAVTEPSNRPGLSDSSDERRIAPGSPRQPATTGGGCRSGPDRRSPRPGRTNRSRSPTRRMNRRLPHPRQADRRRLTRGQSNPVAEGPRPRRSHPDRTSRCQPGPGRRGSAGPAPVPLREHRGPLRRARPVQRVSTMFASPAMIPASTKPARSAPGERLPIAGSRDLWLPTIIRNTRNGLTGAGRSDPRPANPGSSHGKVTPLMAFGGCCRRGPTSARPQAAEHFAPDPFGRTCSFPLPSRACRRTGRGSCHHR